MKKFSLTILISFFIYSFSYAQIQRSNTGLEIVDHENIQVIVEDLRNTATNIGLTEDRIRSRVNIRLRQLGLKPGDRNDSYLYVNINVLSNAFSIRINFERFVYFYKDESNVDEPQLYSKIAPAWSSSVTGSHADDSEFIISALDSELDKFLSDYLDAND